MITVAFTIGLSILDLKKHFSFKLRVPLDIIQITVDGKTQKIVLHLEKSWKFLTFLSIKESIYSTTM